MIVPSPTDCEEARWHRPHTRWADELVHAILDDEWAAAGRG